MPCIAKHCVPGPLVHWLLRCSGVVIWEAHQAFTLDWCDGLPWPTAVSREVLWLVLPRGELFFPSLPGGVVDLGGFQRWSPLIGWCLCRKAVEGLSFLQDCWCPPILRVELWL